MAPVAGLGEGSIGPDRIAIGVCDDDNVVRVLSRLGEQAFWLFLRKPHRRTIIHLSVTRTETRNKTRF